MEEILKLLSDTEVLKLISDTTARHEHVKNEMIVILEKYADKEAELQQLEDEYKSLAEELQRRSEVNVIR